MEKLRLLLNGIPTAEQRDFATRCGTSVGYLRKAISSGQKIAESTCINIERESCGAVRVEDLRTDVDWAVIRNSSAQAAAA
jgi:DNA-binding transcriptional regulator YdaS (Cro superfamily)